MNFKSAKLRIKTARELFYESKNDSVCDVKYRQGFHHGYSQAIDDLMRYGEKVALDHFNGELAQWRYYGDYSEMEMPPKVKAGLPRPSAPISKD